MGPQQLFAMVSATKSPPTLSTLSTGTPGNRTGYRHDRDTECTDDRTRSTPETGYDA